MQNGIAHLHHDGDLGEAVAVFGTTTEGSTCHGPGHIYHAGVGKTFLGFQLPPSPENNHRLMRVIELLQSAGMKIAATDSIRTRIWAKLFVNVGINALTVIYDCRNGELLDIPEVQPQMRQAIEEAQDVARAEQISVTAHWRDTLEVCRATAANVSSMLQDVRKNRKTEIDAINGEVARLAERHGLPAPMNNELVRKVKDIEKRYE
jgi:2-dehydropantoate 2-reductase